MPILTAALALADAAHAFTTRVCVNLEVTYADSGWALTNGVKEDNWQTQTYFRPPYGARYRVQLGTTIVSEGYLGDGFNGTAGCTPTFNVPVSTPYGLWVWSEGLVQSNNMVSQDHTRAVRSVYSLFIPTTSQTNLNITPSGSDPLDTARVLDVFDAYVAGAFALYRHAGGETGNWYYFYRCECYDNNGTCTVAGTPYGTDCQCNANPPTCSSRANKTNNAFTNAYGTWNVSTMSPEGCNRKFILIHEMGHQIARNITTGAANGGNCNYSGLHPCDAGGHAMWSVENANCAYNEAFADFYAADVWNSHSQQDCAFKYFTYNADTQQVWVSRNGPMLDCAADDGPDPGTARDDFSNGQDKHSAHPMEASWFDQCEESWMNYVSTEVDWTRVFWGIHTDGASPPSFTTIAQWLRDCGVVGVDTAYYDLDMCAYGVGGTLNSNWDANVPFTGHNIDQ
ncbi:MAG: hypothetical protein A2138_27695 [Deltaproteobacteria bacterium RBG_16_71_12]|nr:MAG: hypothetical protein A2138_27695 [Deltaproteobacteria bacterium RBG_16_71_12]